MNLVIDCSFIMTSILPDELQLKVDEVYNQISNNVFNVYVPSVFYYAGINDNKLLNSMYYLRSNISHKGTTIDSMLIKALPNIEILQIVCKKSLINWFNEKSGAKLDKQISLSLERLVERI